MKHKTLYGVSISSLIAFLVSTQALAQTVVEQEAVEQKLSEKGQPKLIVVISVDQLRRDRITEALPGFLGKLYREGRVYTEASLDHGISTTCGGHATILTGMPPGPIGIPGNTYVDENFKLRYCVDDLDDNHKVIGGEVNRSPINMKASTFGEWLKQSNPDSKVYSVGGKDRATITMAGHKADGVFWYDVNNGHFTSSRYYTDKLPDYVRRFNGQNPLVDGYLKDTAATWIHGEGSYREDDYEGEDEALSRSSGHPLAQLAEDTSGSDVYNQIYKSPVVDTQTLRLAKIIIEEENLGRGDNPDLLILALSAIDLVGHSYGPRSAESEATLENIDHLLDEFVGELELKLGKDNLLIVLTADHGVAELPEYATQMQTNHCPEQGRIAVWPLFLRAQAATYWHFTGPFDGPSKLIQFDGNGFSFSREYIKKEGLELTDVIEALHDTLSKVDIVKNVWTQKEIQTGTNEVSRLLRNSLSPTNSPDVLLQLHEGCVLTLGKGTTHGSVYHYDRDVPLIYYGWQIKPGHIAGKARTVDIAPSLAEHIGIQTPDNLYGKSIGLRE